MLLRRKCGIYLRACQSKLFLSSFLCTVIFFILLPKSSIFTKRLSLEEQRIDLLKRSEQYVKQLVEQKIVQDHLQIQSANATAFSLGMQDAFGVLLENLRSRMLELEEKVDSLGKSLQHSKKSESERSFSQPTDGLEINSTECPFPSFEGYGYCKVKIEWMRKMWKSDSCYADWGVDGGDCSIYKYLSDVEHFCPPWHTGNATKNSDKMIEFEPAVVRLNFSGLYSLLGDDKHYEWIKMRIQRMETMWLAAAETFKRDYNLKRRKRKILLHMGLLADESGWNIATNAFKGGPLGELVQWADLLSSVYLLGHDIFITISSAELKRDFSPYLASASENCPLKKTPFDMIYIDIRGMQMLKKVTGNKFHLLLCKLRAVDSFGTEPEFNDARYAVRKKLRSMWGKWNLVPMQFNTMLPHTPDNTFLGFVIEQHVNDQAISKENISLVYGKVDKFWEGKRAYLDVIRELTEVHGTVDAKEDLKHVPSYVANHGVLPGKELHALLRRTKIFIGMGFPYEGPAPLEAIANGAVFLNPKFAESSEVAKNAKAFFKDKPTTRQLTSQQPYAETYIGPPHVRMVDIENAEAVKEIVRDILSSPSVKPYIPYEFTCQGMLVRLAYQVEKQEFCAGNFKPVWPPVSALQVLVSDNVQTCNDVCSTHGLICEPSFFTQLNRRSAFDKLEIECKQYFVPSAAEEEIDYPSHKDGRCYLQSNSQLFSCAGRHTDTQRLCPCRDFIKGQVALCSDCLVFS